MPPLEKKEFTTLWNIKGVGKVGNPFARESSCQIPQLSRTTEAPPQQPVVQQTVHVPPPVVVETAPQAAGTYRGYGIVGAPGGPPGGPPYGGVMQMGGISDRNSERERGSRKGSFRGGLGGGGPGGPGEPEEPGSPGEPPNDPDNWGSNQDTYWHPANGWVAVQGPRGERGELGPAGQDEAKLDVKKPDPFKGSDRWKWEPFLSQVHHTFMAKPTIYENSSDKIGFAISYLTGAAAIHYNNLLKQEEAGILVPALHTWIDFIGEFTLYFGLFDPA
ncbi:hypothetical protein GYMLUDRAFT_252503 [Collybiopsis luxurians FD-317 M1]|uniref:Uncharacterized protein n=1 Tax=Collybiopsis luxurians FD-317 M1 TaxID=944289 RepID=A0A0D0C849_9AGAR|nr:hypothetical protein GYMLUDRAFT_252503 [Collybiopsis luxurians FD-317 M1]